MTTLLIIFSAKYLYFISVIIFLFWGIVSARRKEFAIFSVLVLPVSYILSKIASFLYYNPRPFISEQVIPLIQHAADNGFPSDHALLTGTLAAIVTIYNRRLGALLWVLAIIIGIARVLAGIHHSIDIIASYIIAIIGAGVGYIFIYYVIYPPYMRHALPSKIEATDDTTI